MVVVFNRVLREEEFKNIDPGRCFRFTGNDSYSESFDSHDIFLKCNTTEIVDLRTGILLCDIEDDRSVEILDAEIVIHN